MKEKREEVIKCPCCGTEYLPGEIYMPRSFLGQPKDILKDYTTGRVLFYGGANMDTEERYICDNCNTPFRVTAKVIFNTFEDNKFNFDKDYTVPLKKKSLFLNED